MGLEGETERGMREKERKSKVCKQGRERNLREAERDGEMREGGRWRQTRERRAGWNLNREGYGRVATETHKVSLSLQEETKS